MFSQRYYVSLHLSIADTSLKRRKLRLDSLSAGWWCDFRGYKQLKRTLFIQNVS